LGFVGGYKFEDAGARLLYAYSGFFFYEKFLVRDRLRQPEAVDASGGPAVPKR
jgi:hypothetical protein